MLRCLIVFIIVLGFGTRSGSGQCTTSSYKDSECDISELGEMIEMIGRNSISELREMIQMIGKNNTSELREMIEMIGKNNTSELRETIEMIGKNNTSELREMIQMIGKNSTSELREMIEMIRNNNTSELREMIEMIRNNNISELREMIEMIGKNNTSELREMIEMIGKNNTSELREMIEMVGKNSTSELREMIEMIRKNNTSELWERIEMIDKKLDSVLKVVGEINQGNCENDSAVYDCSDIKANGSTVSGVYRIHVDHQGRRYSKDVFCDMSTANGQWLVFQRRKDNAIAFDRGWSDYANGFGVPNGNFWLGNDFLYLLTSKRRYRLRIDLEDFEGQKRHADYSTFEVGSSEDKYRLKVRGYSGDVVNSFGQHSDSQFSTTDADNDIADENCAAWFRGGWWYSSCYNSNLNGVYRRGNYSDGITWNIWPAKWYSLKTTEMKISPVV